MQANLIWGSTSKISPRQFIKKRMLRMGSRDAQRSHRNAVLSECVIFSLHLSATVIVPYLAMIQLALSVRCALHVSYHELFLTSRPIRNEKINCAVLFEVREAKA